MKLCFKCESVQPEDQFAKCARNADGLQKTCRTCMKAYSRDRYQRIKPVRDAQNRAWRDRTLAQFKAYKQELSCQDCGIGDWRVLEFDHLGDKVGNVSDLAYKWSWSRLREEIEKCEVVCANCHRIRTHERQLAVG